MIDHSLMTRSQDWNEKSSSILLLSSFFQVLREFERLGYPAKPYPLSIESLAPRGFLSLWLFPSSFACILAMSDCIIISHHNRRNFFGGRMQMVKSWSTTPPLLVLSGPPFSGISLSMLLFVSMVATLNLGDFSGQPFRKEVKMYITKSLIWCWWMLGGLRFLLS